MMTNNKIKSMSFLKSILFFGIPAVLLYFSVYSGIPFLIKKGLSMFWSYTLCMSFPLVIGLISALVAYKLEGNELRWPEINERFRLQKMNGKEWLWTLGLTVFSLVSTGLLLDTARYLTTISLFSFPDILPVEINPNSVFEQIPSVFMGVTLQGQWWIAGVYSIVLMFNIFGEELWWRGYILPRQELVFGKYTWILHGLLWCLFHYAFRWNYVMLLPTCLAISFVAQRLKNSWPGIIAHFVVNSMGLLAIIAGIAGK